jgi:hypothetical protein
MPAIFLIGRHGEPLVVGMVFADTKPTSVNALQRTRQIVLLGSGDGALPLLPIDTSGESPLHTYYIPADLLTFP